MDQATIIDSPDTTIASGRDLSILQLWFFDNKNIKFLPIGVYKSFPDLIAFFAGSCSLTTVRRENFANLNKLKSLVLNVNKITRFNDDTFQDLIAIERLHLGELNLDDSSMCILFRLLIKMETS